MKINVDRLCRLAGLDNGRSGGLLKESSNRSMWEDPSIKDEADWRYGKNQLSEDLASDPLEPKPIQGTDQFGEPEIYNELDHDALEELVEIDEAMLVQELRRAKKLMNESRRKKRLQLSERAQLQRIIEEEVADVMSDLNLTSQWVYGNKKPRRSRRGQVATAFPGIGFTNKF